jgi:hypothetical protein
MEQEKKGKNMVVPLKKGESRTDKETIQQRVDVVIDMLSQNKKMPVIAKELSVKFNVAESTIYKYGQKAREQIKELYNAEIKEIRDEFLLGLQKDLHEAYTCFLTADDERVKTKWFEIYQNVKKTIREFYPDLVEQKQQDSTVNINLRYNPKRRDEQD